MEAVTLHDAFTPAGSREVPVPAVSVGAGCIWGHVYDAVTTRGGRYVQGGGCTTVGVAGLVQGGGFGSFSKTYGLAAASLLEAEIVTADGVVRTVNTAREPDLFWALKGGGGGTFGVVTRLTLRTHDLPSTFGVLHWSLRATSDTAFERFLERFVDLYAERLFNPHWGEQASARPGNRFEALMLFQGLDAAAAREAWRPLIEYVATRSDEVQVEQELLVAAIPARRLWDEAFVEQHLAAAITPDTRPGARPGDWWWTGNTQEAGAFWHGYQTAWLPASLLQVDARSRFAQAWFGASRHWSTTLHFNKGLAGARRGSGSLTPHGYEPASAGRLRLGHHRHGRSFGVPGPAGSGPRRRPRRRPPDRGGDAGAQAGRAQRRQLPVRGRLRAFRLALRLLGRALDQPRQHQAALRPRRDVLRPPWRRQRALEQRRVHAPVYLTRRGRGRLSAPKRRSGDGAGRTFGGR